MKHLLLSAPWIGIPALTPGDYWLEITTQYSKGSTQTKEPRTVRFDKVLNVPAEAPAG